VRILGLDISSAAVGWCILDLKENKVKYIDSGYFKPKKAESIFDRLKDSQQKVDEILQKYNPDKIGIEDIAKYMPGVSSANTILTLCSFNRAIGLWCYNYLGESPKLFNVMSIRHSIKKLSGLKDLPKKEDIPDLVAKLLKVKFPYEFKKSGEHKKESYDEGDAWAVAYYYCELIKLGR
jgi:crossover junction endodeoxyribonuclease RuvC